MWIMVNLKNSLRYCSARGMCGNGQVDCWLTTNSNSHNNHLQNNDLY